jgi:hypothetical protein
VEEDEPPRKQDAERKMHEAQAEYGAASRDFAQTQDALGAAEDELTAAEAGRDAAERAEPAPDDGGAEQRLHDAEHQWEGRMDEADRAAYRRSQAENALDQARTQRDSTVRNGAGGTGAGPDTPPARE